MSLETSDPTREHAEDVFRAAADFVENGDGCALVFVTRTVGGAVRASGAVMAVSSACVAAGYVSGGCIDADVIAQARAALDADAPRTLRYGEGSPFFDIRLPCGGAIEVTICPLGDAQLVSSLADDLARRCPVGLEIMADGRLLRRDEARATGWHGSSFVAHYEPKLRLRLAGRGADFIALARLAQASGIGVELQSPDEDCLAAARGVAASVTALTTLDAVPRSRDDRWTAFALMFHDPHWEGTLLKEALAGDAFFIGAVGSPRTQALRRETLAQLGCSPSDIDRVSGPIGLVPSMRNASMLAISALAEIVDAFHKRPPE